MLSDLGRALDAALGDPYRVERELGGGGMSHVFLAHETAFDRKVVVKVLAERLAGGVNVARFQREMMVSAGLQHPHIVPVLSAGEVKGLPFFIMPFVEGASLRERIRNGPLPLGETISILQDVARGLAYAHDRGVIHRDVKPGNVLLSHGAAVLTDFGVAKALRTAREEEDGEDATTLTQEGTSLGTPAYMAPEQAAGDADIDHRADLYALGITAYEMLEGKAPFDGLTFSRLIAAHISQPPPPLARDDLPAGLRELVMACLAKDPDHRPQSARDIVAALDNPEVRSGSWRSGRQRSRVLVAAGAIAVLVAAGAGVLMLRPGTADSEMPQKSIAVLPLVNVSGDTADTYFADGMTGELITALQTVPGLRVASRTAVFAYQGQSASPEEIGRDLKVSTLLEGTVRRGGDRLRVTAQLVNADDGFSVWSQTYDAGMQDVFAVQDSIARAIVAELRARFGDREMVVEDRRGTDDLEAYDDYLRGRYFFAQRGGDALRQAIGFFASATERDPDFAGAWAGMADAYSVLPLYSSAPPDSVVPLGIAAADRAIALDSTLAAAYASRAALHQAGWNWQAAERDYRRAIALDPEYATAHQWYGELLLVLNRADSAVVQLRRATRLDPVSPVMAGSYAGALGKAGRVRDGLNAARDALELAPDAPVARMFLAAVQLYGGDHAAAAATLGPVVGDGPAAIAGLYGFALARAGRTADARATLRELKARSERSGYAAQIARVHLGMGEVDSALAWLGRAVDMHDPMFAAESMWTPIWSALHEHPRFLSLLDMLGLPRP